MKVYSSFSNTMNFKRSGVSMPSVYKRYALMYDHIVFNRYGCPIGKKDLFPTFHDYISAIAREKSSLNDGLILGKNKKFQNLFVDMWDLVDDPEEFHSLASEYVSAFDTNEISKFSWGRNLIDEEMGIYNHDKEYKAAAIVSSDITSDIGFNLLLKDKFDSFTINFAPVIGEVLRTSLETMDVNTLFSTELIIPNFEEMTWDEILELREDKYIKQFRNKVYSYGTNTANLDEVLNKDLDSALWDIANQCKPNLGKSIFEAVVSNLPSPTIVNPFGLYYSARDISNTHKSNEENSWVYFIQNIKSRS